MRRIVDLTVPIEEHWRYGFKVNARQNPRERGPLAERVLQPGVSLVHAH